MGSNGIAFPLVPRRRIAGTPFGFLASSRRGHGVDLAGSRPYRPGDDVRLIDRHASARRSSLAAEDELVVREHLTEEAARVVVLCDRGPSMTLVADGAPWLSKPAAVEEVCELVQRSAEYARCRVELDAADSLESALAGLAAHDRPPPAGTFVFAVSDFLRFPHDDVWAQALGRRWDVVPVIVQDPVWEQGFPDVAGVLVPFVDPLSGRAGSASLTRAEVAERRRAHGDRLASIRSRLEGLGLDWALVSSSDPGDVLDAFLGWSAGRSNGARLR